MQKRKKSRACNREQRHGLGKSIDRGAPALMQKQENRRNQRAGVADADPPDEIDNGQTPSNRDIYTPNADASDEQIAHGIVQQNYERECEQKSDPPTSRPRPAQ